MSPRSTSWTPFGVSTRLMHRAGIFCASIAFLVLCVSAASSQPDIMIKDCPADNGDAAPAASYACYGSHYWSPDIWPRLHPDNLTGEEAPIAGQPLYIYIRLKNRGNRMLGCGVVHLYYRDASTGLCNWPIHWISFYQGGILRSDEIGTVCVCCIQPGQTQVVMIPWASVPANGYTGTHHCLLARFVSDEDPMQTPEGPNTDDNITHNNNVAQHNLIATQPGIFYPVSVFNGRQNATLTQLQIDAVLDDKGNDIFAAVPGFKVKMVLGQDLFNLWGGQAGPGIIPLPQENAVEITAAHATLTNITLPGMNCNDFTQYIVNVQMEFPQGIPQTEVGKVYNWTMEQHENQDANAINGEAFAITVPAGPQTKTIRATAPHLGGNLEMNAAPNVATGSTTISYALPADANVTLGIYDGNGNLVRTLISKADRPAGAGQIEWDGRSADGALVPSGTYFYRLITADGTVEKQLKIVR